MHREQKFSFSSYDKKKLKTPTKKKLVVELLRKKKEKHAYAVRVIYNGKAMALPDCPQDPAAVCVFFFFF